MVSQLLYNKLQWRLDVLLQFGKTYKERSYVSGRRLGLWMPAMCSRTSSTWPHALLHTTQGNCIFNNTLLVVNRPSLVYVMVKVCCLSQGCLFFGRFLSLPEKPKAV